MSAATDVGSVLVPVLVAVAAPVPMSFMSAGPGAGLRLEAGPGERIDAILAALGTPTRDGGKRP